MPRAARKKEICRHLCHLELYEEDIYDLPERVSLGPASPSVLLTWPPTADGDPFSAFMAEVDTGGGLGNVLIVVFSGTARMVELLKYRVGFLSDSSETDGFSCFSPWMKTLEQIWDEPGSLPDNSNSNSTQTMKDIIVSALQSGSKVWLTGHSMGGAVAHTAAAALLCGIENRRHNLVNKLSGLSVMTFNAPRELKYTSDYKTAMQRYRIQHERVDDSRDNVRRRPPGDEHECNAVASETDNSGKKQGVLGILALGLAAIVAAVAKDAYDGHSCENMPEELTDEEANSTPSISPTWSLGSVKVSSGQRDGWKDMSIRDEGEDRLTIRPVLTLKRTESVTSLAAMTVTPLDTQTSTIPRSGMGTVSPTCVALATYEYRAENSPSAKTKASVRPRRFFS